MSFLLDTNVVSEWIRPQPDQGVLDWCDHADEDRLFLSVASFAELRNGVERLADGTRKRRLDAWLKDDLLERFEGRILGIDLHVADAWGRLASRAQALGRPMSPMDAFIGATSERHGLTLVTRNVRHFEGIVSDLHNPWLI